nr:hypothetical protein [Candidatus Woesearchaeota archaeon]
MKYKILVGVSNRHVHISKEHLEILFGKGYQLKVLREIRQPRQYAAEETVTLLGKQDLQARIVGPLREKTQVEILTTDQYVLGIKVPKKVSGDLDNTPGIKIKGPKGIINLENGVIIAEKHLHLSQEESEKLNLSNGSRVNLVHENGTKFNAIVRSGKDHLSEFHLDKDEAESLNIKTGDYVEIEY